MKIFRHGTAAFYGKSDIKLGKTSVVWNDKENTVEIMSSGVKDFNTNSKHNYTVSIPLDDLVKIFKVVGIDGVTKSSHNLEEALEHELKALNRIIAVASGIGIRTNENA